MTLTLRPTRLYGPAVYAHLKDWEVWEDGKASLRSVQFFDQTPIC
jgi:hypothetical protein